jgi:glycosyltransferase involved in cell wall biosynthesis
MKTLAIVIPVYNEGQHILETIRQIIDKVHGDYKAYFIYDMEEDTSVPHIKSVNDPRIVLMRNKYGRGVLNAIKTGLEETKEDNVIVFMADLSEDPKFINDMVAKASDGFDIVCGSRYMKGGAQIGAPRFKSFLSRMAGISLNLLTGIPTHDISDSFKLYSRKVLNNIKIESVGGFEIGMEIVVKAYLKGYSITEIPVVWRDRTEGRSNFKLMQWLPRYLHWYFYLLSKRGPNFAGKQA